jgi:hypothetical protein
MTCHDKNEERMRRFRDAVLPSVEKANTIAT